MMEKARAIRPNASRNQLTSLSFLVLDILTYAFLIVCILFTSQLYCWLFLSDLGRDSWVFQPRTGSSWRLIICFLIRPVSCACRSLSASSPVVIGLWLSFSYVVAMSMVVGVVLVWCVACIIVWFSFESFL